MKKLTFFFLLFCSAFLYGQNEILRSIEIKNDNWRYNFIGLGYDGFLLTTFGREDKIPSLEIRKYDTLLACNYNKSFSLPNKSDGTSINFDAIENSVYVVRKNKNKIWLNKLMLQNFENEISEFELKKVTSVENEFVINDYLVIPLIENGSLFLVNYNVKTKEENLKKIDLAFAINSIDKVIKVEGVSSYFILINRNTVIEINQNLDLQSTKQIFQNEDNKKVISLDILIEARGTTIFSGTYGKNNKNNFEGYFISKFNNNENKLLIFEEDKLQHLVDDKIKFSYFTKCYVVDNHYYFLLENYKKETTISTTMNKQESRTFKVFNKAYLLKSDFDGNLSISNVYQLEAGSEMINDKLIYKITSNKVNPIIYFTTNSQFFANNSITKDVNDFEVSNFYFDKKYFGKYSSKSDALLLYDNVFLVYHKHSFFHFITLIKVL